MPTHIAFRQINPRPAPYCRQRHLAAGNEAEADVRAMPIAHALVPEQANANIAEANEVRLGVLILALAEGHAGSLDQVAQALVTIAGEPWATAILPELTQEE